MKLSTFIARRYFFAKSSSHAVNIITGISVLGILVGTAALIVVLSAFNGLEDMVRGFYSAFDPDLKINPAQGKFFEPRDLEDLDLEAEEIDACSFILEEKALLRYRQREYITTLRGVDEAYVDINQITQHIRVGNYHINQDLEFSPALIGAGVAYYLRFGENDFEKPVEVFIPSNYQGPDLSRSFKTRQIYPLGVFAIQPEFDEKYAIVPISLVRDLLGRPQAVSSLEIKLAPGASLEKLQSRLRNKLGPAFEVKNRDEQQAVFFKVMKTEGLFTFLVFALILAIATFTIAGSLSMLMFEKKENLATLKALGMRMYELRQVFFKEGMIISLSGGGLGMAMGVLIVLAQKHFSLLTIGQGYAVEAYPVMLKFSDLLLVGLTVTGLCALVSWLTSRRLNPQLLQH